MRLWEPERAQASVRAGVGVGEGELPQLQTVGLVGENAPPDPLSSAGC